MLYQVRFALSGHFHRLDEPERFAPEMTAPFAARRP